MLEYRLDLGYFGYLMDFYPEELAPEFEPGGAVATLFEEWWERVHARFQRVPEEVAREWLHRHWGYSPFQFLSSDRYRFEDEELPSGLLKDILSSSDSWDPAKVLAFGERLYRTDSWLAIYMREHRTFPSPIIILDNSQGIVEAEPKVPCWMAPAPRAQLLIEGHRRHALACWMVESGGFGHFCRVWVMRGL